MSLQFSCLCLLGAGTIGKHHFTQLHLFLSTDKTVILSGTQACILLSTSRYAGASREVITFRRSPARGSEDDPHLLPFRLFSRATAGKTIAPGPLPFPTPSLAGLRWKFGPPNSAPPPFKRWHLSSHLLPVGWPW